MEPVVSEVFRNLFPRKPDISKSIMENMKEKGFSKAHPIIVGKGYMAIFILYHSII